MANKKKLEDKFWDEDLKEKVKNIHEPLREDFDSARRRIELSRFDDPQGNKFWDEDLREKVLERALTEKKRRGTSKPRGY